MPPDAVSHLHDDLHDGGGLSELEVLRALPPEARIGWWTLEWYWNQPGVPHVKEWVAKYRKIYPDGSYPSARIWFGYAGLHAPVLGDADRAYILDDGKVVYSGTAAELSANEELVERTHSATRSGPR